MTTETLICDIECYRNFFLIAFKRIGDGRIRMFERSSRGRDFNPDVVRAIMSQCQIVTFNGRNYDLPMIYYALDEGRTNAELKHMSDRIITGNIRYWEHEKLTGINVPRIDHIDLIEPQPAVMASLKILNGRLHGRHMQDLPIEPDQTLTEAEMDLLREYCGNDLDATELLFEAMTEPLEMREALGADMGRDFRSSSDAQIGEQIVKMRVEKETKQRIEKAQVIPGSSFEYRVPEFITFTDERLQNVVARLRETTFYVDANGKPEMPKWLDGLKIPLGGSIYSMGIGGLHSNEENRAVYADDEHKLIDADVASQYPAIILILGLYPKALGPAFLPAYRGIREDRIEAKKNRIKYKDQGLKTSLNGTYGKLGSPYSALYAPHLMLAVTLTGQLSLLMLIERAEAAGIPVVSGNTDGVLFRCPVHLEDKLYEITKQWEAETGFDLEFAEYNAIFNESVNSYIALKTDGSVKRKGPLGNPWSDRADWGEKPDLRSQMMKNPQMPVLSDAVVAYLRDGVPIEDTIYECDDIRMFVTVIKVTGGATWNGEYLGKVVRYIWAKDGAEILRAKPNAKGTHAKVPKTDGSAPLMTLPDEFPEHLIDYGRYIAEAKELLMRLGAWDRPPPIKKLRFKKADWVWYPVVAV